MHGLGSPAPVSAPSGPFLRPTEGDRGCEGLLKPLLGCVMQPGDDSWMGFLGAGPGIDAISVRAAMQRLQAATGLPGDTGRAVFSEAECIKLHLTN